MIRYSLIGLIWIHLATLPAVAQTQVRQFTVTIEGAGTGSYTQTFKENPRTGVVELTCTSTVRIKKFVVKYNYDITATECWRNDIMCHADCTRNDNGDVLQFHAADQVWTSSYHELPHADWSKLPVLDMDTNTVRLCQLRCVGKDQFGMHYQLTGGLQADLWYDAQGRLCRRVMMRKGRLTTLALVGVSNS